MPLPEPEAGLVVRYEYVWASQAGRAANADAANADKDHPACILAAWRDTEDGAIAVIYLPISHTPPVPPDIGIELTPAAKKAAGLDVRPQWVLVSQANKDDWGFDLRQIPGRPGIFHYGYLPPAMFETIKAAFLSTYRARRVKLIGKSA